MTAREAWDELGKWLIRYAHRVGGGYGRDESVSDAHFGFMEAVQTWTGQKDTFKEWAKHKVRKTVRHRVSREYARKRLCLRVHATLEALADRRPAWTVRGFLEGMSGDVQVAVRTVLSIDTVDRIARDKRDFRHPSWGFNARKIRRILMARLKAKGWDKDRIDRTVQMITEALD